jgi:hypothetical protein
MRLRILVYCLLATVAVTGAASASTAPAAMLNTFAGTWYGHDRYLKITDHGIGSAWVCCAFRALQAPNWRGGVVVRFRLSKVTGTPGNAVAEERGIQVLNQRKSSVAMGLFVGEVRTLRLRNGVILDRLTRLSYCDNAQDRAGRCGA